jgi:putative transposase
MNYIRKGYKYRIYPTEKQKEKIENNFRATRKVWNYTLEKVIKGLESEFGKIKQPIMIKGRQKNKCTWTWKERKERLKWLRDNGLSKNTISKKLPKMKDEIDYLKMADSKALIYTLKYFDAALKNWVDNSPFTPVAAYRTSKDITKGQWHNRWVSFLNFHSRKDNHQSYTTYQGVKVDFENGLLTIPKIKNIPIILHRKFDTEKCKIKNVTISRKNGKYYAALSVLTDELPKEKPEIKEETIVGFDMNARRFIVSSNGESIISLNPYRKLQSKKAKLQKILSQKKYKSKNWQKLKNKIALLDEKIINQRKDWQHNISYYITHNPEIETLVFEKLQIKNMISKPAAKQDKTTGEYIPNMASAKAGLNKSLSDVAISQFLEMVKYKCEWYGKNFIQVNPAYTSKTCSNCGFINKELKSELKWKCPECGIELDRDVNAAINIRGKYISKLKEKF